MLWALVALIAVTAAYEDHYAQYRDPAESTTTTTEQSPTAAEYEGGGGGRVGPGDDNPPRPRKQHAAPSSAPTDVKDDNNIKNAVAQILSGRDIDEVLNMVEGAPTSPTRSGAVTPPPFPVVTDGTVRDDQTTVRDDTVHVPVRPFEAAATTDDWTTATTEDNTDDVTEFRSESLPSSSSLVSIGTEVAGGDIDDDITGFTEVYTRPHSTAPPTRSHPPLTPHRVHTSISVTVTTTTTQRATTTQTVVTGATPLAVLRSDSAEYYSDEDPGPAPGAVAALGPGAGDAAAGAGDAAAGAGDAPATAGDAALRYKKPRVKAGGTRSTRPFFDIPIFLEIIQNLTRYVETNITQEVNETLLQRWSVGPTCPLANTSSTTPHSTTEHVDTDYGANMTGTIMGKCFVCGLRVAGIPQSSQCADAFAGDFLPLVPVDPTARGKISDFRKYCRFMDVPRWHFNGSDPRSLWGRWTGGCSVRWVDLTGVYTQRSCRNRHRAVVGRHFASKRMAKLEMALQHTDNGCIVSPVATLLPLSRGINLYARFHACVCTGNWCNVPSRLLAPHPALLATLTLPLLAPTAPL